MSIYNLIETKLKKPQDLCVLKFLRGNILQSLLLYDEAVELYRQFLFDYSQMDEDEKTAPTMDYLPDLQITNLDCIWYLASTYMAMKQYFAACSLYQKYLELESDRELKANALWSLMYIFNDEQDWQRLSETIDIYDQLETDTIDEAVAYYKDILSKKNIR